MNVSTFLEHYQILENPFKGEEAQHDIVFDRIEDVCRHPEFEKVCGDLKHPAAAIVFGEKGSGKTAMRMQIERAVSIHNREHPEQRSLIIPYDELNPILDRLHDFVGKGDPEHTLASIRLPDHMDAMLFCIVPRLVDQVLGELRGKTPPLEIEEEPGKRMHQRLDTATKRDLIMLQLCYDDPDAAPLRMARLKRVLRHRSSNPTPMAKWMAIVFGAATLVVLLGYLIGQPSSRGGLWAVALALLAVVAVICGARFGWLWSRTQRLASDLARHVRVVDRPAVSFRRSLMLLDQQEADAAHLPRTGSDEPRYAMFARLLNVIRPFQYDSIVVLVDRIDEPTLVSGEPKRMQALVWPMLNNKFLQQRGVGVKLLLPLELRYLLNREGPEFFREARLDKQNFVERLTWSGAMLYDLCAARLNACRASSAEPMSMMDLFDQSITHQDLVDVLDQMQQPRDAFKFLYQLVQEHCSNIPDEKPDYKIARQTLDSVKKQQAERLGAMLRGVGPA
jgi:hypothetical protein